MMKIMPEFVSFGKCFQSICRGYLIGGRQFDEAIDEAILSGLF